MRKRKRQKGDFSKPKKRKHIPRDEHDPIQARPLEVSIEQARGDSTRLIKRFMKKVRKEEVLKPFYGKLRYHQTKSQKRRQKRLRGKFLARKMKEQENRLSALNEKIFE